MVISEVIISLFPLSEWTSKQGDAALDVTVKSSPHRSLMRTDKRPYFPWQGAMNCSLATVPSGSLIRGERGPNEAWLPGSDAGLSFLTYKELSTVTQVQWRKEPWKHQWPHVLQSMVSHSRTRNTRHIAQACVFLHSNLGHAPRQAAVGTQSSLGWSCKMGTLLTAFWFVTSLLAQFRPSLSPTESSATGKNNSCPKLVLQGTQLQTSFKQPLVKIRKMCYIKDSW